MSEVKLYAAPLQGYTEGIWRHAHAAVFGGYGGAADTYFAPFMRVEKGEIRRRDLRDICVQMPVGNESVPQIIFKDVAEFRLLAESLSDAGFNRVDLNMGCPFPPQCHKGRGAAMVQRTDVLRDILSAMNDMPGVEFSVKMRLGLNDAGEWRRSVDVLNEMNLSHVTVHPRVGRQQYSGEPDMNAFADILCALRHPVVYNGDVRNVEDIASILTAYPGLSGIMAGRGLLARPSLFAEWRSGELWDDAMILESLLSMHKVIYTDYVEKLAGESQVLSKLVPFWEYAEPVIGHKCYKSIKKARALSDYMKVINTLC